MVRMRSLLAAWFGLLVFAGPLAAEDRPNILFCIADDWGWPHAGAYGAGDWIRTPAFDRIAEEGVLFENAFTSNPKCCPSRASMVAGRNSWQMAEAVNHIVPWPSQFVSYVDLLSEAGYHTGYTGKGWGPGTWEESRATNPAGEAYDKFTSDPGLRAVSRKDYARNFIEHFLAERPEGHPFCFWLGTHEPHRVYEEGAGVRAGRDPKTVELPDFYPDNRAIREDMLDYALEVEHFDAHVARCLDHLEATGELDNTIVVMTSDHGMPFPRVKGQIYEHGFHLPLAVRWGARGQPGRRVTDFINASDFAPTFVEAAGLERHPQFTGRSFLNILESEEDGRVDPERPLLMLIGKERHDLGRPYDWGYPVRAIRTPDFLYIRHFAPDRWPAGNPETGYRNCDHSPTKDVLTNSFDEWYRMSFGKRPEAELYEVARDLDNVNDLAGEEAHAETVARLRDLMEKRLAEEGDPRFTGNAEWFDTIPYTGARKHAWDTWEEASKPPR